jgi:betaine-aldehyde dehydrogenase
MQMRIGGREAIAAGERWIPVANPATREVIDQVPEGGADDVDAAVEAAEEAFPGWAKKTARERGTILFHAAARVRGQHQELAHLLTSEQGKPIREAIDEIRGFANILEFYAGISAAVHGDLLRLGATGECIVIHEPIGICGAIIPANMPAIIMGWKVGPALLAGNTMVLKPASEAPLTNLRLAGILESAGLPAGVLNVVTGRGATVGEAIVIHRSVRRISFTGDTATGRRIRELAAPQLKEVTFELGGSDPMIVWKDADLERAVAGALRGRFYNAGQTCTAVKRLFLHEEIAGVFMRQLQARTEAMRIGNGADPSTEMGPLVSGVQRDAIARVVEDVRDGGMGTILSGGKALREGTYEKGFFYAPTLITDATPDAPVLRQEIFGPVLPAITVPDLDTAIDGANNTRYGLGASVWTQSREVAKEVALRVQAGVVWVNRHLTVPPEMPFGGVKESGIGRENGIQAYYAYTRTKSVLIG